MCGSSGSTVSIASSSAMTPVPVARVAGAAVVYLTQASSRGKSRPADFSGGSTANGSIPLAHFLAVFKDFEFSKAFSLVPSETRTYCGRRGPPTNARVVHLRHSTCRASPRVLPPRAGYRKPRGTEARRPREFSICGFGSSKQRLFSTAKGGGSATGRGSARVNQR